ncbi:MAG: hypothetical protein AAB897_02340 [Patescibacteria group bacterium]
MSKILVEERKINRLVKKAVVETFRDMLSDPDAGLELQAWVKKRLSKKPTKTIPLESVLKKYDL